jgi:hypothetical protein
VRSVLIAGLGLGLFCGGCQRTPTQGQSVTAESVQGTDSAFTTMRPLRPGDLVEVRPPLVVDGGSPDYGLRLEVTYYGSPAVVIVTAPDGQVVRDTTAPRDESCDGFAEQHANDPPESDGIGCLSHDRAISIFRSTTGSAFVQFTATDTGSIWFGVETLFGLGSFGSNRYEGLEFRVHPGETQIFRVTIPDPHGRDSVRVVPITGRPDTVPPRVDPDSAHH